MLAPLASRYELYPDQYFIVSAIGDFVVINIIALKLRVHFGRFLEQQDTYIFLVFASLVHFGLMTSAMSLYLAISRAFHEYFVFS